MRKSKPQPIGAVLKEVVETLSQAKKKDGLRILAVWPAVAGRGLARYSKPAHLRKGTLVVNVEDSSWLYQATLQKAELLAQLQKKTGQKKIKNLQFRIGEVK